MTASADFCAADAIRRLVVEFAPGTEPEVISQVVTQACRDLRGAPAGALPELVERLAREQLRALI